MKPALFHAITGSYGGLGYGRLSTMVVTSVKGDQVYGRTLDHGNPTHCRSVDVVYRFATEDDIRSAVAAADLAKQSLQAEVDRAERLYKEAQQAQREAIRHACSSFAINPNKEA